MTEITPLPMTGCAEVIHGNLLERNNEKLQAHNPNAVRLMAIVLAAMQDAAQGSITAMRCEGTREFRSRQFRGLDALNLGDQAAMALECAEGLETVLAGARAFWSRLGYSVGPTGDAASANMAEAVADGLAVVGEFVTRGAEALRDLKIDREERARLMAMIPSIETVLASLKQADATEPIK